MVALALVAACGSGEKLPRIGGGWGAYSDEDARLRLWLALTTPGLDVDGAPVRVYPITTRAQLEALVDADIIDVPPGSRVEASYLDHHAVFLVGCRPEVSACDVGFVWGPRDVQGVHTIRVTRRAGEAPPPRAMEHGRWPYVRLLADMPFAGPQTLRFVDAADRQLAVVRLPDARRR